MTDVDNATEPTRRRPAPGRVRRAARALRTTLLVLAFAVVAIAVVTLVVIPKATGAVPLTVLTGSMRPTIEPGSMIVVRPADAASLEIGDVITFQLRSGDPTLVTHRIVGVVATADELTFRTQGDDNSAIDPDPVRAVQIRGKVWYQVPWAGHLANRLDADQRGRVTQLLAGGLLLGAVWMMTGGLRDRLRCRPSATPLDVAIVPRRASAPDPELEPSVTA